jgi:hypothetical protein
MPERLRNMVATPAYAAGTVGNVVLVDWRHQPTKAAILEVDPVIATLLADTEAKIGLLVVVRFDNPAPDHEARLAFAAAMKTHASRIYGSTITIEGEGLRATANRLVLMAIALLGNVTPVPKVCGSVPEAAVWLSELSDQANGLHSVSVAAVSAAFNEMKRHEVKRFEPRPRGDVYPAR